MSADPRQHGLEGYEVVESPDGTPIASVVICVCGWKSKPGAPTRRALAAHKTVAARKEKN